MLIPYTPIASLPDDQRARLQAYATRVQLEGEAHLTFEGLTFSRADLKAHFYKQDTLPNQPLFG